uniref:Uncharacterized protein n=1 Tax=Panagrolaimus superbus TaxID=310955 RepID=A0A914Z5C4_9BILA
MFTISEENAELGEVVEKLQKLAEKNVPEKPIETPLNVLSESFVTDYNGLQDKVDELNEEKIELEAKMREMEMHMKEMVLKLEQMESVNAELTEALSSVNKEKKQLSQDNKLLTETVTMMQMQLDTLAAPVVDQKERGNSLFGEVDEARLNAEEELKKIVEQNVQLQQENEALQIKVRRFANASLTHADQNEIQFQKKHSEQIFAQLQEYMKVNQRYAQQIEDLTKKLVALEIGGNGSEKLSVVILKRQLEISQTDRNRLNKLVDELNKQILELNNRSLEIPTLKASVERYEKKVALLEDEIKLSKELSNINNKNIATINDENLAPSPLNIFEVPSTPKESRPRPRLVSPSKTQPSKNKGNTKWVDRLRGEYKQVAKENPNRQRSLDRRNSRFVSMPKDPQI